MGIYQLGKSFLNKLPPGRGKAKNLNKLPIIHHFFLDVNGILHNVAQLSFGYKGGEINKNNKEEKREHLRRVKEVDGIPWESLMDDYKFLLFEALDKLLDSVDPKHTICLCVDGVAPAAKIIQQRNRRIGGGENVSRDEENPSEKKARTGFSSTFITPGTKFMEIVDIMLEEWLYESKKKRQNVQHIYSPYSLEGEGEHKLFYLIDKLQIGNFDKDTYAVDGLDSDLISLMLLRSQRFISIRGEREQYVEINEIKQHILESCRQNLNPELVLKDFVVMLYLIGNDFLPRFSFVGDVGEAINKMMDIYSQYMVTNITTEEDTINWNSFGLFLEKLADYEVSELMRASIEDYYYLDPLLHNIEITHYSYAGNEENFMKKYRRDYYRKHLLPNIGAHLVSHINIENEIDNLCKDMCEGLFWVLKYYTASEYSKTYIYPRQSAPLIMDLWKYVSEKALFEVSQLKIRNRGGSKSFNYVSQLMTVMPKSKNFLIPEPYASEVGKDGKFGYLIPDGFPVKKEKLKNKNDWFMEKSVLPIPDISEIISFVNNNGISEINGRLLRI